MLEIIIPGKKSVTLEDMQKAIAENNAGSAVQVGDDLLIVATEDIMIVAGDKDGV
jgi:hypothetical protein